MNKNMLPGDTSAVYPSGIRLGTPEMTRIGMGKDEMDEVADLIHLAAIGNSGDEVRDRAADLKNRFTKIMYCWESEKLAYQNPIFEEF